MTVLGRSSLTNAHTSVVSICGSAATSGASRWLDAPPVSGASAKRPAPTAIDAAAASTRVRKRLPSNGFPPCVGWIGCVDRPHPSAPALRPGDADHLLAGRGHACFAARGTSDHCRPWALRVS